MKDFFHYLLGETSPALFAACIFFAAFGVFIVLMAGTRLRDPSSIGSPEKFSWKYLWSDNFKRIIASMMCVLATLRFMPEMFNMTLTPFTAWCVGLAWDSVLLLVKQKTSILDPKQKP